MNLKSIEMYRTPKGEVMIEEEGKPLRRYEQTDREFTDEMMTYIQEFYPKAFQSLSEIYTQSQLNRDHYRYLIVHRFIRCNFTEYDNRNDIDQHGIFNFEFVSCPMRGECKYCNLICNPQFNTKLSAREIEVMRMYNDGFGAEVISEKLFISIETVKNHKRNSYLKLGIHSMAEFVSYANQNGLFDNIKKSQKK